MGGLTPSASSIRPVVADGMHPSRQNRAPAAAKLHDHMRRGYRVVVGERMRAFARRAFYSWPQIVSLRVCGRVDARR